LLESINRQIPGFLPAYLLLAKGKLAVGNDLDASLAITKVLQIDSRNEEGSILNAMIRNKKKDYDAAMNSLQEAISINFKIRENPLFMLIKGEIEYAMEQYATAEETMVQAIALPAVKRKSVEDPTAKKFKILSFL
jgi:tetratricopeptide repeat protein 21B